MKRGGQIAFRPLVCWGGNERSTKSRRSDSWGKVTIVYKKVSLSAISMGGRLSENEEG